MYEFKEVFSKYIKKNPIAILDPLLSLSLFLIGGGEISNFIFLLQGCMKIISGLEKLINNYYPMLFYCYSRQTKD